MIIRAKIGEQSEWTDIVGTSMTEVESFDPWSVTVVTTGLNHKGELVKVRLAISINELAMMGNVASLYRSTEAVL